MPLFAPARRRPWLTLSAGAILTAAVVLWCLTGPLGRIAVLAALLLVVLGLGPAIVLRGWRRAAGAIGGVVLAIALLAIGLRMRYGGGARYPDTTTTTIVAESALESLAALDYPPGNVAVSADGRIFFNYHPFALAQRFGVPTMFELVDGKPQPFPDAAFQGQFQGVFGMTVDHRQRLWLVEPAGLDHDRTHVVAFDLGSRAIAFEYWFPAGEAQFAQDLRVAPDGNTVYLADTGMFRFTPASLFVLDVVAKAHRRVLVDHPSTQPQDWAIQTRYGLHKLAYGLITFVVGIDGIELSADGAWLYYAAMTHDHLYKVPTAALRDPALSPDELARQVVEVARKPLSDGITLDPAGDVLITDIEHGAIARLDPAGRLTTLIRSPRVIWADGVVVAPDGAILFTDSAIPSYIDQLARPPSLERLTAARPYHLYRFRAPREPAIQR